MRGITATARRPDRGWAIALAGRMARSATVVAAVVLVQGCGAGTGDHGHDPMSEARALYEANCLECHGADARGGGPLARALPVEPPSLLDHLGHHTMAQLIQLIRGGVPPAMPPTALGEDQIRQVIDYVWTLVPESEVAALRAMQQHMEMMGGAGMDSLQRVQEVPAMPGMDHSQHMQGNPTSMPATDTTSS
jgi:mono/diheme cytochrome c family protein